MPWPGPASSCWRCSTARRAGRSSTTPVTPCDRTRSSSTRAPSAPPKQRPSPGGWARPTSTRPCSARCRRSPRAPSGSSPRETRTSSHGSGRYWKRWAPSGTRRTPPPRRRSSSSPTMASREPSSRCGTRCGRPTHWACPGTGRWTSSNSAGWADWWPASGPSSSAEPPRRRPSSRSARWPRTWRCWPRRRTVRCAVRRACWTDLLTRRPTSRQRRRCRRRGRRPGASPRLRPRTRHR